jgi:hypothetical protein
MQRLSSDEETLARYWISTSAAEDTVEAWEGVLSDLEAGFLAWQAQQLGGFGKSGEDLESHVLPFLIRQEDWVRFVRWAAVATNLRGLATGLDSPTILQALERSGLGSMVETLVGQVSDPLRRARARAVVLAERDPADPAFGTLKNDLERDLEAFAGPREAESAEALVDTLVEIALRLAPELQARWQGWITTLEARAPDRADRLRRAVFEGLLRAGALRTPLLREVLAATRDTEDLCNRLPAALSYLDSTERWELVDQLPGLDPWERSARWHLALVAVGEEEPAQQTEKRLREVLGPVPWSPPLVAAGETLWRRLPAVEVQRLLAEMDEGSRAALRVIRLGDRSDPAEVRAAREALAAMAPTLAQLHWTLRYLGRRPRNPEEEWKAEVAATGRHLQRLRYGASPPDLLRYLEQVVEAFLDRLAPRLEAVLWAPGNGVETLRELVRRARSPALRDHLFERAEELAASAAESPAEGFELRREILVHLAARRCASEGTLAAFEAGRNRLLPEEEDSLREEVARRLGEAGQRELASEVASGIEDRGLRLRRLLELGATQDERGDLLAPDSLYEAAADLGYLRDERRALAALQEEPIEPENVARRHLQAVERPSRRIEALVDLSYHALTYQEKRFRPSLRDRTAAILPLKEELGVVESDPWLLALVPELAELGTRLGSALAVAEIQEALERVADFEALPWSQREAVLVHLLVSLPRWLPKSLSQRRKRGLFEWLGRWPERGPAKVLAAWHRLFPWLVLSRSRLGLRPWGSRHIKRWCRRFDGLTADQKEVLEEALGIATATPRSKRENGAQESSVRRPDWVRARVCHRAQRDPEDIPALVAQESLGRERRRLALELAVFGGLPWPVVEDLLSLLDSEEERSQSVVALDRTHPGTVPETAWLEALTRQAAGSTLDGPSPTLAPIRRRLWTVGDAARPKLATAAKTALATGGREGAQRALQLFLHAHLAPRLGEAADEARRRRLDGVAVAERAAVSLGTPRPHARTPREEARGEEDGEDDRGDDPAGAAPDSAASIGRSPRHLAAIFRRWSRGSFGRSGWAWTERVSTHWPRISLFLAAMLGLLSLYADSAWLVPTEPSDYPASLESPLLMASTLLMLVARVPWVLGDLSWRSPLESRLRLGARVFRGVTVALPFSVVWFPSLFRSLLDHPPRGLLREAGQKGLPEGRRGHIGNALTEASRRLLRWASEWYLAFLVILDFGVAVLWLSWLAAYHPEGAPWLSAVIHLSMAYLVWLYTIRSERGVSAPLERRVAAASLALLALVPVLPLVVLVLVLAFDATRMESSLVSSAWAGGVARLTAWRGLLERLRSAWDRRPWTRRLRGTSPHLDAMVETGETDRQLVWLYRLKSTACFFEAALLCWLLLAGVDRRWLTQDLADFVLEAFVIATLMVGLAGVVAMAAVFVRRWLRLPVQIAGVDGRLLATYWTLPHLLTAAGLVFGVGLYREDPELVGGIVLLISLGGIAAHFLPLMLGFVVSLPEDGKGGQLWLLLFAFLGILAMGFLRSETPEPSLPVPPPELYLAQAEMYARLAPLLAPIGSFRLLGWFLRPVRLRDLMGSTLSPRLRRRFRFLATTELMPLGGLAVPLWIYLRPRWWPKDCQLDRITESRTASP